MHTYTHAHIHVTVDLFDGGSARRWFSAAHSGLRTQGVLVTVVSFVHFEQSCNLLRLDLLLLRANEDDGDGDGDIMCGISAALPLPWWFWEPRPLVVARNTAPWQSRIWRGWGRGGVSE